MAVLLGTALAQYLLPSCHAQFATVDSIETVTTDSETRWTFQALSPVAVHSPIVRLGDVVKPLDPRLAAWQRLKRSPVGLVPVGGERMTIQRDRLAVAISDMEATPLHIDWLGPSEIEVVYQAGESKSAPHLHPASHQVSDGSVVVAFGDQSERFESISHAEGQRIVHWIELALDRQHPHVAERFAVQIDPHQRGMARLRSISGITAIQMRDPVAEGDFSLQVMGRSGAGPVESEINVTLKAHPLVVVPRESLSRGHRIRRQDLTLKPLPAGDVGPEHLIDLEAAIGLEVHGNVRGNHPIVRSAVGAPTLIHRGDLIEVRVSAGGIMVTTNAKALSDGAQAELIEIETLQPRKRLVARVVEPGTVEIITRAPRVRS